MEGRAGVRTPVAVLAAVGVVAAVVTATVIAGAIGVGVAAPSVAEETGAAGDDVITATTTLRLTPDRPGHVEAVVSFDLPDRLTSVSVYVPERVDVAGLSGFAQRGGDPNAYNWTADDATPSLTLSVPANETSADGRASVHDDTGYDFVDPGPWAIVKTPQVGLRWAWSGSGQVSVERRTRVEGSGVAAGAMAYLGPHRTVTRRTAGQRISLVIPTAADPAERPEAVLDSVAAAADRLRIGGRDDRVTLIAAPTTVDWSASGLQYGDTAAWVAADQRLDAASNTWLHEYVHTRQAFGTTASTRWVVEASAEYYAALLTLEQGHIDYEAFRRHLALGTRYDASVLAEPETWASGAPYLKGALVVGRLDRRVRVTTDSRHAFADVLAAFNRRERPVDGPTYASVVRTVAGSETASLAEYLARTDATPETWSEREHRRAFGRMPPLMDYRVADAAPAYRVTGPYRSASFGTPPTVYAGEALTVNVSVANAGDVTGSYEARLVVNGIVAATRTGTLGPGERTTVPLQHEFGEPGQYAVSAGFEAVTVSVRDPATPRVTSLAANATHVEAGRPVGVTATVAGRDAPTAGVIEFGSGGEVVATREVALAAGESREVGATVRFETPGDRVVTVGDRTVTVTVAGDTGDGSTLPVPGAPGFTGVTGLVAVVVAGALAARFGPEN